MGVHILYDSNNESACMYDSVTDWAFGPVISDLNSRDGNIFIDARDRLEDFLKWLLDENGKPDPRSMTDALLRAEWTVYESIEIDRYKIRESLYDYETGSES